MYDFMNGFRGKYPMSSHKKHKKGSFILLEISDHRDTEISDHEDLQKDIRSFKVKWSWKNGDKW